MSGIPSQFQALPRGQAVSWFGRLQLLRLLGKGERSTVWRVEDSRTRQEMVLVLPRNHPVDDIGRQRWLDVMHRASRLNHPQLAAVVEVGLHSGWPFALYDPRDAVTLAERLPAKGYAATDAAGLMIKLLQGLAFAHEAGVAHHDLQTAMVLLGDNGQLRLAGVGVAAEQVLREEGADAGAALQAGGLRGHRDAAERDVLAGGILLHQLLTGHKPLDESDVCRVINRLPPLGREMMRLPFATAQPVPEVLRAIANRATDRQERQRYRNARTLLQALEGWQATEAGSDTSRLSVLADRVRHGGAVPSLPGAAARAARLAYMMGDHVSELAEVVLEDPALSFELIRQVNGPQVRDARLSGGDPVLTIRRAVSLLGLDGVRRSALALREWPGSLGAAATPNADELLRLVERCKRAGRLAQALRPPGYDGEVVYLVAMLQNLGRLLVNYHFADEAQQIRRLMQAAPAQKAGEPEDPGMTEEGAAYAVLGTDIETLGASVARGWGLDDAVMTMIRRLPLTTAVHSGGSDYDTLRAVAACANEAVDAVGLPAARVPAALTRVLQRYGRLLGIGPKDLQEALQVASASRQETPGSPAEAPLEVALRRS